MRGREGGEGEGRGQERGPLDEGTQKDTKKKGEKRQKKRTFFPMTSLTTKALLHQCTTRRSNKNQTNNVQKITNNQANNV